MYELELENLLKMSATASTTVAACETYIQRLETLKKSILRIGNKMGLASINQVNSIDKMLGKLDRKADFLEGEEQSKRSDSILEEASRKDDKFLVKPLVDELQARRGYRT